MTETRDTDRRFFQRLPQRSILRLQDPRDPATDQFAILLDISRSGVRLEVARTFTPGVTLTLYLPKTKFGPPRRINALVMWAGPSGETVGWHQLGCRFAR